MTNKDKHLIKKYLDNKGYVEICDQFTYNSYRFLKYKSPRLDIDCESGNIIRHHFERVHIVTDKAKIESFYSFEDVISEI